MTFSVCMPAHALQGSTSHLALIVAPSRRERVSVGDLAELGAMREVFGQRIPHISSTKSLSGRPLGAAGVQEAIYSLLMLDGGFAAASANIETLDPAAEGLPILRQRLDAPLNTVMSNSFGFGGTNATLVFSRFLD